MPNRYNLCGLSRLLPVSHRSSEANHTETPPADTGQSTSRSVSSQPLKQLKNLGKQAKKLGKAIIAKPTQIETTLWGKGYSGTPLQANKLSGKKPGSSNSTAPTPTASTKKARQIKADALKLFHLGKQAKPATAPAATPPPSDNAIPLNATPNQAQFAVAIQAAFPLQAEADAMAKLEGLLKGCALQESSLFKPGLLLQALTKTGVKNADVAIQILSYLQEHMNLAEVAQPEPAAPSAPGSSRTLSPSPSRDYHDAVSQSHMEDNADISAAPADMMSASCSNYSDALNASLPSLGSEERAQVNIRHQAWQVAITIARTPSGAEALSTLMQHKPASPEMAITLLQATDHLQQHYGVRLPPQLLASYCQSVAQANRPQSLAAKVVLASMDLVTHENISAVASPAQKAVLYAWKEGFREDCKGSDLAYVKAKLHKFAYKSVPRIQTRGIKNWCLRVIGKKKTALAAMKYGMNGGNLGPVEKEREKFQKQLHGFNQALMTVLPEAHTVNHFIAHALANHFADLARNGSPDIGHYLLDSTAIDHIAKKAIIARQSESDVVPEQRMMDIGRQAHRLLDGKSPAEVMFTLLALLPEEHQTADLKSKLSKLIETENGHDLIPESMTEGDAHKVMMELISNQLQQSNKVRFVDGGAIGLDTSGLSINLAKLLNAVWIPISPRLDLRGERAKQAFVEVSRSSQGGEIVIGSQQQLRGHAGAGAFVGYQHDFKVAKLSTGATFTVIPLDKEWSSPESVVMRVRRSPTQEVGSDPWEKVKYDDPKMVKGMADCMDFLFKAAETRHTTPVSTDALWEKLACQLYDRPDISIGKREQSNRRSRYRMTADIGATVRLGTKAHGVSMGPNIGGGYEKTRYAKGKSTEKTGHLQVSQQRLARSSRLFMRAGIGITPTNQAGQLTVNSAGAPPLRFSRDISEAGHTVKLSIMRVNGYIDPRVTYSDSEQLSLQNHLEAIHLDKPRWMTMLLHANNGNQASAKAKLEKYCSEASTIARYNQNYLLRYRMHPQLAESMNQHKELLVQQLGNKLEQTTLSQLMAPLSVEQKQGIVQLISEKAPAESIVDALVMAHAEDELTKDENWIPEKLAVSETSSSNEAPGPALGIRAHANARAEGQRELLSLSYK